MGVGGASLPSIMNSEITLERARRIVSCCAGARPERHGFKHTMGQLLDLHAMKVDALLSSIAGASVARWRWSLATKACFESARTSWWLAAASASLNSTDLNSV